MATRENDNPDTHVFGEVQRRCAGSCRRLFLPAQLGLDGQCYECWSTDVSGEDVDRPCSSCKQYSCGGCNNPPPLSISSYRIRY
jgi:hypothetical protein